MKAVIFILLCSIIACGKENGTSVTHMCPHLIGKWRSNDSNFGCYVFNTDGSFQYVFSTSVANGTWSTLDCLYITAKDDQHFGSEKIHVRSYSEFAIDLTTDKYVGHGYKPYYKK